MVDKWLDSALARLYPPVCVLCGWPAGPGRLDLCQGCEEELPRNRHGCRGCALPLSPGAAGAVCGRCQQRPPATAEVLVPWLFEPPMDFLVQQLKYHGQAGIARLLGGLLAQALGERLRVPDLVVPVPLHPARLRRRGFNQAGEICRALAAAGARATDHRGLRRVRATPAQAGLDATARRRNLRGAFSADRACFDGRRVALVDDVITTGSTVQACARALRTQGRAAEVSVWALARA